MDRSTTKPGRIVLTYLGISVAVTVLVILLTQEAFFAFTPLKRAELSLIDWRFQKRGRTLTSPDSSQVVIVEISQESFKSLDASWPWPKAYYARLVRNLHRAGARAIALDIVFSSRSVEDTAGDGVFRRSIRDAGNVILAGNLDTESRLYTKREGKENYGNAFIDTASAFGLVNVRTDDDGILRRYMPFVYHAGPDRRVPSFPMTILNTYFHENVSGTVEVIPEGFRFLNQTIPAYDGISFLINYYGPSGTFRRVNIADVLDDADFQTIEEQSHPGVAINTFDDTTLVPSLTDTAEVPAGLLYNNTFNGKIVIVGSTRPEDKDLFTVPIGEGRQHGDNQMFGVEIHANIIQSVLDHSFIIRQPLWLTVLVIFGLSLFTFVLTAGLKAIKTTYSALIEILGVAIIISELYIIQWASLRLFVDGNFLADMTSPFLAVILCYVGSTIYNYITEREQKALIKEMFSQYVNPTVVDELVAHPEKLRLGGERKELTVFFSDIENFTQISEQISPETLVAILNEYLTAMTGILLRNAGTLDKYEGDAIVAFWGAPVPQDDHALRACRTAVQMQHSLVGLRSKWLKEGKPPLNVRIGINSGEVIVGNMGGVNRFDYTVIGDSVNLGSRLEGANKQYRTSIMMSGHTYRLVKDHVIARELDMLVVAGKTEPIRVYELIGIVGEDEIGPEKKCFLEFYVEGIAWYRQKNWRRAIEAFTRALEIIPDDYPAQLYIERSQMYIASPPPDDWNGVFILRTK